MTSRDYGHVLGICQNIQTRKIRHFDMTRSFILEFSDLRSWSGKKYGCVVERPIKSGRLIVRFIPPIPRHEFDAGGGILDGSRLAEDLEVAMIMARYEGELLVPKISKSPLTVNICIPKENGTWDDGPWSVFSLAELYETESQV